MKKMTVLKLSDEEIETLKKAFKIIDELTDEGNRVDDDYGTSWASEKLLYHINSNFIVNGKDMEKCFDILEELGNGEDITFSMKED